MTTRVNNRANGPFEPVIRAAIEMLCAEARERLTITLANLCAGNRHVSMAYLNPGVGIGLGELVYTDRIAYAHIGNCRKVTCKKLHDKLDPP